MRSMPALASSSDRIMIRSVARRQQLPQTRPDPLTAREGNRSAREPFVTVGGGGLSTMSALDTEYATPPALADRIAMVRAQLAPIRSRRALLDSYRRESLCRLAGPAQAAGSAAEVLDVAYAMRWLELESEMPVGELPSDHSFELVDD